MKAWHWAMAGLLVIRILGPEAALAFQQTPLPGTSAGTAAPVPTKNNLSLENPQAGQNGKAVTTVEKPEKGGLLGLFPRKLDFGLDLLYAPEVPRDAPAVLGPDPAGDDVMIRGSVKKRF